MKERALKCWVGNLDGLREGLVLAHNQTEAVKIIGISVNHLRDYFNRRSDWSLFQQVLKPLTLYTRLMLYIDNNPWEEGRCKIKLRK